MSTLKTLYTKWHKWVGSDKPDFNEINDNFASIEAEFMKRGADPVYFGADPTGVADSTTAFLNAIAYVSALPYGGVVEPSAGKYKLTKTLMYDFSKCQIHGKGGIVYLDFTGLTDDKAVWPYSSGSYAGRWRQLNEALTDVVIVGSTVQAVPAAGKTGLYIGHPTFQNNSMFEVSRVSIEGFAQNIEIGSNAWRVQFNHLSSRWGKHFVGQNLTNAGENMTFHKCAFFDNNADWTIGYGLWHFNNCSFDNSSIIVNGDCVVHINNCHFERPGSSVSSGYRIDVQHAQAMVVVSDSDIVPPGSAVAEYTTALFRVADTNLLQGLKFRDCKWFASSTFKPYIGEGSQVLVAGKGRVEISGFNSWDNAWNFAIAKSLNVIYNADAELGTLAGWKTKTDAGAGTGTIVVDTVEKKYGTSSFKLSTSGVKEVTLYQKFAVRPQQQVMGQLWWKADLPNESGGGNVRIRYYNANDEEILNTNYTNFVNSDWSCKRSNFWSIAPPGTYYAQIEIGAWSSFGGTSNIWIDDVILNVV